MSKNYFHETQRVPVAANADVSLYFEAVFDPGKDAKDQEAIAFRDAIGSLVIPTGADEITWGYGLNTKRIPTYGGEVVQILSMFSDKMIISGTCRTYNEQRTIYEYFKNYIAYTTGAKGVDTQRHQKFLRFRYPARKWSFVIMVQDISDMRMAKDIAAPTWSLTAEIVSENDRYELGAQRLDKWANVLKQPVASGRSGRRGPVRGPRNFKLVRDGDPFGDTVDAMGRRGKITENFDSLVASLATGDINTLRNNPLVSPDRSADEIWSKNFGDYNGVPGGVGGGGGTTVPTSPGDPTAISFGTKTRVFATAFGGHGDASNTGHAGGQSFDLVANPDSYAELSTNMYNSANGTPADGKTNDYAALGNLPALTPIRVTNPKNGKSMILYKRDVGFGGPGPDGRRGTADDPKIDIWHTAADQLGFNGFDYLDIEVGVASSSSGGGTGQPAANPNDLAQFKPVDGSYPGLQSAGSQFHYPDGPEGPETSTGTHEHSAYDFMAPAGTKIYAPKSGKIIDVGYNSATSGQVFGDNVKVELPNGYVWVFRHVRAKVKQGDTVQGGQLIATISEWDGGTHTHIEIWRKYSGGYMQTNMVDPLPVLKAVYK